MKKNIIYFLLFLILLGIWLVLTFPFSVQELVIGVIFAGIIVFLCSMCIAPAIDFNITIKGILYIIPYLFVFFFELIKSNFDIALRVIQPEIPLNPGIVRVKTTLKSSLGRMILANSITLTPGTLTVETDGEIFYIHCIDVAEPGIEKTTEKIVLKFERYLEVIFG